MTVASRKAMCHDCPWRKKSSPGWLGASSAQEFLRENDRSEGDMPCHTEVDYSDPAWRDQLDEAPTCVGGHHFNANSHKLPINPAMRAALDQYGPNPDVFGSWPEFMAHHDNDMNRRYVEGHAAAERTVR